MILCGRSAQAAAKTDVTDCGCRITFCLTMRFGQIAPPPPKKNKNLEKASACSQFSPNLMAQMFERTFLDAEY